MLNFKTIMLALSVTAAAMVAHAEDPTCATCPALPNSNWSYEFDGSETSTTTEVTQELFNQAQTASGGRASDKNKSNFNNVTTTVIETTTNHFNAINPAGKHIDSRDASETFSNVISSETVKVKVK